MDGYIVQAELDKIFEEIDEDTREQQEAYRRKQALTHRPWDWVDSDCYSCISRAASALKMNYIVHNWKFLEKADQRLIQERIERDGREAKS